MLYLLILLLFVFFVGVAMTIGEGLWSNTITLVSILLSSLIGSFGGILLGSGMYALLKMDASFMWYFLFAGTWIVFSLSVVLIRLVADKISGTRMKFIPPLEMVAGPLMGLFVAVIFTGFAASTLIYPVKLEKDFAASEIPKWQLTTWAYVESPYRTVLVRFGYMKEIQEIQSAIKSRTE